MSGHWSGIVGDDGAPYNDDFNHINNYAENIIADTFEQMYGMIWSLADSLAGETEGPEDDNRKIRLGFISVAFYDAERGVKLGMGLGMISEEKAKFDKAVNALMQAGHGREQAREAVRVLIHEGVIS